MKTIITLAAVIGFLMQPANPAAAKQQQVEMAQMHGGEQYLTDAAGRTLYWNTQDEPGKSNCRGVCVLNWPVFYMRPIAVADGLKADDLAAITREDGARQITFRGYPLYYFKGDTKPGEFNGNGMMGIWYTANPSNFPPH